MQERILRYFKVNIDECPVYLEVRPVCDERYLCFFSTFYSKDHFCIEEKYGSFGFKVINEKANQRYVVYGKLTIELAQEMWLQIFDRLHRPDREVSLYPSC
jgi:hypothetical protein